jgi:hypothetical protein
MAASGPGSDTDQAAQYATRTGSVAGGAAMNDKRIRASMCPACGGTTLEGSPPHGPEDDLRAIRDRDAAYDSMPVFRGPLGEQPTGRLQMAADRRMLLRMLDAELDGR